MPYARREIVSYFENVPDVRRRRVRALEGDRQGAVNESEREWRWAVCQRIGIKRVLHNVDQPIVIGIRGIGAIA